MSGNRRALPQLRELVADVKRLGERGLTITRFKGLGEMDPEELWETTLDPAKRTLLRFNLDDALKADEMFRTLMGEKVEPRRDFIQKHALEAESIDSAQFHLAWDTKVGHPLLRPDTSFRTCGNVVGQRTSLYGRRGATRRPARPKRLHPRRSASSATMPYRLRLARSEEVMAKRLTQAQILGQQGVNLIEERVLAMGFGDAAAAFRAAIDLRPDSADGYCELGVALTGQGKDSDAEAAYGKAIELRLDFARAHVELGLVLSKQKKLDAGEAAYRKAIELSPQHAPAQYNLGANLHSQGKYAAAESAYRRAIDRQPDLARAHQGLGVVLLHQAQFDEALACVKKAYDLLPATDPGREQALPLLRHSERCAALNARLPAILRGAEKPAGAAERIELARLCTLKKLHAAAARFYSDAFSAEPQFAQAAAGARYHAACAGALAGCTQGQDADQLDDTERARWCRQALEWLRQDLAWWGKQLDNGDAQVNAQVRQRLRQWQADPALAGVRGKDGLARLPDEEREQWESLWSDVDALVRRGSAPE